jgi:hypothetical protein
MSSSWLYSRSNLARQLQFIGSADSRAGLVLALDTAMLGVLAALSPDAAKWDVAGAIFSAIAVVGLLLSLLFLSFASFPRTKGPRGSVLYFEGIVGRDANTYLQELRTLTSDAYVCDLARQCHRNAEIARAKYVWLRGSLISLYAGVVPWALAVFLLYLHRP